MRSQLTASPTAGDRCVAVVGNPVLQWLGVNADNPTVGIIHRGKFKSLTKPQRRWLKRRQAVEPAIGHLKSDNRMDRCWLKGSLGDALHAVLCAAGYNLRWLMRAMLRLGLKAVFCARFGRSISLSLSPKSDKQI